MCQRRPNASSDTEHRPTVFTPHLGASTSEAQVAVSVEIARQAVMFLKTGEAVNALNLPRLSAEELKKGAKIEVLKEEDVKKLTNSAAQKPK